MLEFKATKLHDLYVNKKRKGVICKEWLKIEGAEVRKWGGIFWKYDLTLKQNLQKYFIYPA